MGLVAVRGERPWPASSPLAPLHPVPRLAEHSQAGGSRGTATLVAAAHPPRKGRCSAAVVPPRWSAASPATGPTCSFSRRSRFFLKLECCQMGASAPRPTNHPPPDWSSIALTGGALLQAVDGLQRSTSLQLLGIAGHQHRHGASQPSCAAASMSFASEGRPSGCLAGSRSADM